MLPSIRFIDHCAAISDNELSRDDSTRLAPIRSVEQRTARVYDDARRDSVIQTPPVRLEERVSGTAHVGARCDIIIQRMLNEHHDVQTPQRSPIVDRRMKLAIKSLLLAPPAAPLVSETNSKRSPSSPASIMQDSPKKQPAHKHAFRTTVKARAIYRTMFPQPKLLACPPSTETLAPGTHLYADSKRWPNRGVLDRSFIKRLAVNDIDSFRPAPVIHAPNLLALLQAVTAMTKQNKKARRRCKDR
ncbi:hypothetical protein LTR56_028011 [Elasticomyces elasticus]|nr:hypothetical protein LTR22_028260 [Elasticomyces elasticus]KAK3613224.1 hypothetical protein LTR56_028011 [Elasticomyces elasticus]KAK4904507.1 hypothetical protein LTR49_026048 [Elasticomyces elasticus]